MKYTMQTIEQTLKLCEKIIFSHNNYQIIKCNFDGFLFIDDEPYIVRPIDGDKKNTIAYKLVPTQFTMCEFKTILSEVVRDPNSLDLSYLVYENEDGFFLENCAQKDDLYERDNLPIIIDFLNDPKNDSLDKVLYIDVRKIFILKVIQDFKRGKVAA